MIMTRMARSRWIPIPCAWVLCFMIGLHAAFADEPGEPAERVVRRVRLSGTILEADGERGLLRFLDIREGARWDDQLQSRILRDLEVLGYRADGDLDERGELTLKVSAVQTVRRIFIEGHFPLFEFQIRSNLTWYPGYRLKEGEFLAEEIRKQERDIESYLHKDGYYDATARISLEWTRERPRDVDVRVRVSLNAGFWRLRYGLGEIKLHGVRLLGKDEVRSRFDHCCLWIGRTSTQRINDDVKKLLEHYQERGHAGVRLLDREVRPDRERRKVDVTLRIDERRKVELSFSGNRELSEKALLGAVTVFRAGYYSTKELDESARNIFRLYQQNGFFEARVGWRWLSRDSDPVRILFVIHEGPQLKVREVHFVRAPGSRSGLSYPEARLQEIVQTKPYPRLGLLGLGEGGYATSIQLDQDVGRLEDFYHREGFPEVRVSAEAARSPQALDSASLLGLETAREARADRGDLFVRFLIDEGRRELVEDVRIRFTRPGPHPVTHAALFKVLRIRRGDPYSPLEKAADAERLLRLLRTHGHPYPTLEVEMGWNPAHTRVVLEWKVDEGELVTFGEILIRGNYVTRESLIRKDLPFRTGMPFNENLLLEAQQNLEQRQLFTYVKVTANPGENAQYLHEARELGWKLGRNPVPVLVEVGERYDSLGDLGLYVGFATDNYAFGAATYWWRNLFGRGIEVELRTELGQRRQTLSARLANPRLYGQFLRLDLRGFWRNEITPALGPVTTYGANTELTRFFAPADEQGRRLPPQVKVFTRLEFTISQLLLPLGRSEASGDLSLASDQTQALKLSVGAVWDRRVGFEAPLLRLRGQQVPPNPLMPVNGFLISGQATVALCCAFAPFDIKGSFLVLAAQVLGLRQFGPVLKVDEGWPFGMKRFGVKANLRVHYGIPFSHPSLPVVERFYAGGDTATRGFTLDTLKVEEVRAPIAPLTLEPAYRLVPQGGNIRILSTIEWEFAITPKILGWPLVGAVFLDTGAVFDSWAGVKWNDFRMSLGISLFRLLTHFGPLSLEYAYPLTLPGQEPLPQSDAWKREPWWGHWPGRIHFNWGIPISL